MSIRVMTMVWDSTIPAPERFTLLALADWASEDGGHIYPSIATLARKCALSERAVQYHIKKLEDMGVLVVDRPETQEARRSSRYVIQVPVLRQLVHPQDDPEPGPDRCRICTGAGSAPVQDLHPTGADLAPYRCRSCTPYVSDTSVDPSRDIAQAPPSQKAEKAAKIRRFDEFWSAYPRKIGKDAARVKWKSAIERKIDPEKIIESARRHADAWAAAGREVQFIPHPATWLHQGRYDDEPELSHLRAVPAAVLTTYEDFLRAADATTASVLIRARFVPPPQPPNHPQRRIEWDRERAREWIIAHESQIRAALKGRESA